MICISCIDRKSRSGACGGVFEDIPVCGLFRDNIVESTILAVDALEVEAAGPDVVERALRHVRTRVVVLLAELKENPHVRLGV